MAVPIWVKKGIQAWQDAAGTDKGRLFRSIGEKGNPREKSERLGHLVGR